MAALFKLHALKTQRMCVRGGVAIFAHSLSLGMSLVLHWSDAVADAWLGGTELIW